MPCCTPEVLLSEQSAIAEFPLSFCYSFVSPLGHYFFYMAVKEAKKPQIIPGRLAITMGQSFFLRKNP